MDLVKVQQIHNQYRIFRQDMYNEWEEYAYLNHCIRKPTKEPFEFNSLLSDSVLHKTIVDAGGMQTRFLSGGNSRSHFINSVGRFEVYISSLAKVVFIDYPQKMKGSDSETETSKAFQLILSCSTRDEMIDTLAEEKVRSIFYGNPADVFLKDKCKLELGTLFSSKYRLAISLYSEILGRRNAIIHNSGRVDKKYIRENPQSTLLEGKKIIISENYLRGTIGLLVGIAAETTSNVVENIYKGNVQGILGRATNSFENCYKIDWYKRLLQNSD